VELLAGESSPAWLAPPSSLAGPVGLHRRRHRHLILADDVAVAVVVGMVVERY